MWWQFSNTFQWWISWAFLVKSPSGKATRPDWWWINTLSSNGLLWQQQVIILVIVTQNCVNIWGNNYLNSLAPGRFHFNFRQAIFKLILVNGGWGISHEIALRWMPLDLIDDKSTLVPVMAWCRQAPSHYLSQCRPRPMSPYGVARPQWVN